jgi:thioesterase domain-containing protein
LQNRFGIMRRLLDRADFFTHPTIRAQALMIEQSRRAKSGWKTEIAATSETFPTGVVPLNARPRRRDDAPPLFVAPMADASPTYLGGFAAHLMAQQRCYGLDPRAITNCPSLEELAAVLVASLEKTCPEGPYYLGGHCFGGVLAYEMAQQLAAKGRCPKTLFLFDVPTPGFPHPQRDWRLFAQAVGKHASQVSRYVEFAGAAWRHAKKLNASRLEAVGVIAAGDSSVRLMRRYQAKPYLGESVVFVAREHAQTGSPLDRRLGWRTLIQPSPEIVHVDASHCGLFGEPAAMELAAVCRQRLPRREMESVLALAASVNEAQSEKLPRVGVPA